MGGERVAPIVVAQSVKLWCLEFVEKLRLCDRPAFALDPQRNSRPMAIFPVTRKAVLSQSQQARADALHTVVPGIRLEFLRWDRDSGHPRACTPRFTFAQLWRLRSRIRTRPYI